jgi:hypothetical protein
MSEINFINDDPASREMIHRLIASEDYSKRYAPDERRGIAGLAEESINLVAAESFTTTEIRGAVNEALAGCLAAGIEVVSATPEWVELRVPCALWAISPLQKLLARLDADLPQEIGGAINYAFREMLSNAIEHGGRSTRRSASRSDLCVLSARSSVGSKTPARALTPHGCNMPRSITRLTIPSATPPCVKRKACAPGDSASC